MARLADIFTDRLRITAFQEQHLSDAYVQWLNDPEVVKYSEQRHRTHELNGCRSYFRTMEASPNYFCALEEHPNGLGHIGNISVTVDQPNRLADIAILIGARETWGAGFGFEAWNAVLCTLLNREGFRKVTGGTVKANLAMVRIMEKSGMRPDGVRPAHYLIDGDAVDIVHFARFAQGGSGS